MERPVAIPPPHLCAAATNMRAGARLIDGSTIVRELQSALNANPFITPRAPI